MNVLKFKTGLPDPIDKDLAEGLSRVRDMVENNINAGEYQGPLLGIVTRQGSALGYIDRQIELEKWNNKISNALKAGPMGMPAVGYVFACEALNMPDPVAVPEVFHSLVSNIDDSQFHEIDAMNPDDASEVVIAYAVRKDEGIVRALQAPILYDVTGRRHLGEWSETKLEPFITNW